MSSSSSSSSGGSSAGVSAALQFAPFASAVDVAFWAGLARAKLEHLQLDTKPQLILAAFAPTSTHREGATSATLCLGDFSLPADWGTGASGNGSGNNTVALPSNLPGAYFGVLHNANTLEAFKRFDAAQMAEQACSDLWRDMQAYVAATTASSASSSNQPLPSLTRVLSRFLLLSFADLKAHKYAYWFCFPALLLEGLTIRAQPVPAGGAAGPQRVEDVFGQQGSRSLLEQYACFAREHPIARDAAAVDSSTVAAAAAAAGSGLPASESFFLVSREASADGSVSVSVHPIESWPALIASGANSSSNKHIYLAFVDPSPLSAHLGWPARNLLAFVWLRFGKMLQQHAGNASTPVQIDVLSFRDTDLARALDQTSGDAASSSAAASKPLASLIFPVELSSATPAPELSTLLALSAPPSSKLVGWEKNAAGKALPRLVDLGSAMSPSRLAEASVDLNLKLMRWRALPALDLPLLGRTKCLLLGSGTLGCNVARLLLGWGVRHITLVDSGRVSYSNPVRQSLFEFEDCFKGGDGTGVEGKGKPKAEAAAAALQRIYPHVQARGVQLSIPMPGHAVSAMQVPQVREDIAQLEALIAEHDAVFLLTDSRESRWLPTLMGAAQNKLVLNAALGFDTFLVMRHGDRTGVAAQADASAAPSSASASAAAPSSAASTHAADGGASDLGCYFCSDVVAPTDSLSERTLDQQCTVTRPGLAMLSSALLVELFVTLLHHPLRGRAPADTDSSSAHSATSGDSGLGIVPHQVRGFLARFNHTLVRGASFAHCTACSAAVLSRYARERDAFVLQVLNGPPSFLENASGLTEMKAATEKAMLDMEMLADEDEGAEDDF